MSPLLSGFMALLCGVVWLALLVATEFNVVTISAGLIGALFLTGTGEGNRSTKSTM